MLEGAGFGPRSLIAGVPARRRRDLTDEECEDLAQNTRDYVVLADSYRDAHPHDPAHRVVVAPDKFKGSLRAEEVAGAIAEVLARCPRVEVVEHPVADCGEGTVDFALAAGFDPVAVTVAGPLGRPVAASFAACGQMAVIEMASAAGLALLPDRPTPGPESIWAGL